MTGASNLKILRVIPLLVAICFFSFPTYAKYGGGTGEPNDPYLIYTAEQMNEIGLNQEDWDKHFKLMEDIDLGSFTGTSYNIGGEWDNPFTGVFDGNGHTISNFTYVIDVNEPLKENGLWGDENVGLFGRVAGPEAQIKNLVLIDPNIYPAATCSERVVSVGAIAGNLSDGSITNCHVVGGRISGDFSVGGLVGSNSEGIISNCSTSCDITWAGGRPLRPIEQLTGNTGNSFGGLAGSNSGQISDCYATGSIQGVTSSGGLVGNNISFFIYDPNSGCGVISNCYATGDVFGEEYVGGLVGENSGRIHNCHAVGNVSGSDNVGGLVGYIGLDEGSISDSYATGDISGNERVGGLVGYSNGLAQDSYATGEVSGTIYVGGLTGFNGSGTINRSYASGAVSGSENVGGLVGRNGKGIIDCCYARGEVLGTIYVGGLVGTNFNMIRRCYAANAVSGIQKVGGLVGDNWSSGATIITSLWDIETSGLTDMCGIQSSGASGCDDTYGKTTIEMQTANTFLQAGWDFVDETANGTDDIWKIFEVLDYPRLWWEKYGGGTGKSNDPYLIYTAEHLNTIGLNKEDADKHFKLMADIDLSAYQGDSFNRIGHYPTDFDPSWHYSFTGVFDGNNHTISNFTYVVDVNEPPSRGYYGDEDVGLFGTISGTQAQIKNLGLVNPNIYPATTCSERVSRVGAIAGHLSRGSITNCYVEGGRISGDSSVGGLVGSNIEGTISNCYTTCDVTWAKGRRLRFIEEPWGNTGYSFGGLAGSNGGQIYNCYATGRIEADLRVGGLVGGNSHRYYFNVVICDSYATGDVIGEKSVGGLAGENDDTIRRCCAFGNVSGSDMVGGLVGFNERWDDEFVGIVTNSYAISRTSGNNNVGGMAGVNAGMLITCYSVGEVSGTSNVGGLVGTNRYDSQSGTAENCFWDMEASGQSNSTGGTGKTTEQMQDINTYMAAGWEFIGLQDGPHDIWSEPEGGGYPILWWQLPEKFGLPAFSGGTGEPNNPYLISTPDELNSIGHNPRLMTAYFKLNNDIDLADVDFSIIGSSTLPFKGVFDGNSHLIRNFTYDSNEMDHIGLFRIVKGENAQIKNLGLINPNTTGVTGDRIGSLIGSLIEGTVTNCYAKGGSVLGIEYIGGLVGMNEDGTVTDCYARVWVRGQNYVGGLVGVNKDGTVTACCATGPVSGHEYISGLVGGNWDGTVKNSYATGPVSGSIHVGGLVGMNWYGTLNACYSTGSVSGDSNVGGLLGNNDYNGSIIFCFWNTEASGLTNMCGTQDDDATGCNNIYGKTTIEMQKANTFLNAGWDFVDETANGTEDIWWILEGQDYPRLWWEAEGN